MLYDDYRDFVIKYKKEFGDQVIVLYECGSFFEIYDDGSCLVDMKEISELLNIVVSRRNKAILEVSRNNFEMAGFPSHSLKKFLHILLSNNYTIVLVTQTTPPPNPKREVTEILSPGTTLDVNVSDSNNLMVIYFEETEMYKIDGMNISVGCSIIDISTGKSYVYETSSFMKDSCYPYDEVHRLISSYSPKEIELTSLSGSSFNIDKLREVIDFGNAYLHDKLGQLEEKVTKPSYQEALLLKVYKQCGILSPIEKSNMERKPLALISYVRLLQFSFLHNERIIEEIQVPIVLDEKNALLLSYNACHQLDILPPLSVDSRQQNRNTKANSLLGILNNCKTSIGRRYFKQRLMNPSVDIDEITQFHDTIDSLDDATVTRIRQSLSKVYDIERLYRKCILNMIHPFEIHNMLSSIDIIECISPYIKDHIDAPMPYTYKDIVEYMYDKIKIDKLVAYNLDNLDGDLFVTGYDKDVDELQWSVNEGLNSLNELLLMFNGKLTGFKLDHSDKEGYFISTTSRRWNELWRSCEEIVFKDVSYNQRDFHVKSLSTSVKITNKYIDKLNDKILATKSKLIKLSVRLFKEFASQLVVKFNSFFESIIRANEYIDFVSTCFHNNNIYKLKRPTFVSNELHSFVKAEGVRHLIIEQNQKNIQYVANDVSLGVENQKGMLLYGINSAGKSSLMKSIGLMVIMAQAGMYVACDALEISPYDNIFTRISSSDDIIRGQSTFTKEIIELRNILKRATSRSLVIGDELCSGTESISALSIVSAGIITLANKQSSFVFATHLHDLVKIEEVNRLPSLKVYHLSVRYDIESKRLVYDRKLKQGNGSTLYGIEVCKSLDLDTSFLEMANTIRLKVMGVEKDIISGKTSRYNTSVYVDRCVVCDSKATEIHHIKEQHTSDEMGYISSFHKNSKFNLVGLCEQCHDDVHNSKVSIDGYIQTSVGKELLVSKLDRCSESDNYETHDKQTLNKEVIEFIASTKARTKKEVMELACSKFNISKYRVQKIISQK